MLPPSFTIGCRFKLHTTNYSTALSSYSQLPVEGGSFRSPIVALPVRGTSGSESRPIKTGADQRNAGEAIQMYCTSGLLAYPPRMGTFSEPVCPSAAYATATGQGYMAFGTDSSAFYTPLGSDTTDAWRSLSQTPSAGWPYDSSMCGYPYGTSYGGLDVRRKNATRESTSTLKAWLYEHIKNPYPTKGEKIMLAIITKMTLTQVSTWFANARRRLKKENKMQWSPRNRTENDEDDKTSSDDDDDDDGADGKKKQNANGKDDDEDVVVDNGGSDEMMAPSNPDCSLSDLAPRGPCTTKYPTSGQDGLIRSKTNGDGPRCPQDFLASCVATAATAAKVSHHHHHLHPQQPDHPPPPFYYTLSGKPANMGSSSSSSSMFSRSPLSLASVTTLPSPTEEPTEAKPRIWSLADVATSRPLHSTTDHRSSSAAAAAGLASLSGPGSNGLVGGGSSGPPLPPHHCGGGGQQGQNFQPWSMGPYADDGSSFASASTYANMAAHPGAMTLPFDRAQCDAAVQRLGGSSSASNVRRVTASGQHTSHYSCRMVNITTADNSEACGKTSARPDLDLVLGLNGGGTRYHQPNPATECSTTTAFKPFLKRLGS